MPAGVTVETPPLRDQGNHTVYWRLRLETPTSEPLRWQVGSESIEKTFIGAEDPGRLCTVSARRPGRGFWDRLLQPGEPGFDADSAVQGIAVRYPRRSTPVFGLDIPWWVTFIVVSMVAALCARPFLRVQF